MPFQFTHPWWLPVLALLGVAAWRLAWHSHASLSGARRYGALGVRLVILTALGLALAGLQYRMPVDGLNLFFLLDRSDSVPAGQQEAARELVNTFSAAKRPVDGAGVVVFGADAAIESTVGPAVDVQKIHAVLSSAGTDLAGAIRLATAAFPETGQRRVVVLSDGNQTVGDALQAVASARSLGVTVDVVPLGASRGRDVVLQKVALPPKLKRGQTFDLKVFIRSDQATRANLSVYRDERLLGTQAVDLQPGKNLFTFAQTLEDPGFHAYDVRLDDPGDTVPQNNRSSGYTTVRGEPRVLVVSSDPASDRPLAEALSASQLEVRLVPLDGFPSTLAEMQSYDALFLSNIAAGDLGMDLMRLLAGAARDFGVGVVVLGGDQAFAAGGYRATPLEELLPVDMELSSKKVLPKGALALVIHATEFPNGNQWARDIAFAALQALGPQDEMGIVLWDGNSRWLFDLGPVGDRRAMGRAITGMNPGDMTHFQEPMEMAHAALRRSTANLKHMVVFSDGDPGAPSAELLQAITGDRITVSTVMIGGHVEPGTMTEIAQRGRGRFYDVRSPGQLPQIFVKEAAVILKSAIIEDPFQPQMATPSEILRGLGGAGFPTLRGYVATTPKARAEIPLVSNQGDPILAQWQFGLGRTVAFTSDARSRWAADWLPWPRFRQFWSQTAQWALRKVDAAEFNSEVALSNGTGSIQVEALDARGEFRNFLNLQALVVDPKGQRQVVRLEQQAPGRYSGEFTGKEVGAYMINLLDLTNGVVRGQQALGASLNYSPEFDAADPDLGLLRRLAEAGAGRVLDPSNPADNPFLHDRHRTHQPRDLWWWLLATAILLFPVDVGLRRVQLDREEWARARDWLARRIGWRVRRPAAEPRGEGMAALLARKEQVRGSQPQAPAAVPAVTPDPGLLRPRQPTTERGSDAESGPPPRPDMPGSPAADPAPPTPGNESRETATQRLLDAKRRARRRL